MPMYSYINLHYITLRSTYYLQYLFYNTCAWPKPGLFCISLNPHLLVTSADHSSSARFFPLLLGVIYLTRVMAEGVVGLACATYLCTV